MTSNFSSFILAYLIMPHSGLFLIRLALHQKRWSTTSPTQISKNLNPQNTQSVGERGHFPPEQEFFLVLVRLQLGLLEEDLAQRASISQQHLSRIWITLLDFLHSQMRSLPIWSSKDTIDRTMQKCFKDTYPSTRVIIDCT